MLSVTTNDTIIPVPFFIEYQDQAILIDELTQRIHMLGKCIKAAGTYDASNRALKRLLDEATENELIPVDNWSQHREKGGVEGAISFLPIRDMVEALQVLVELRAKVIEDQDRITGIVDIMRGTTDARETLGGQRIKSNTANTRLDDMRESVAVFARDLVRLVAEVVAKHFKDKTIIQSSGILYEEEITLDDYESMRDLLEPQTEPAASQQQPPQSPGAAVPPAPPPGAPGASPRQPGQPGGGLPPPPPGAVPPGSMPMQPPHPAMPGGQMPTPAPMGPPPIIAKVQRIGKALKLLRDDAPRGYRITIETDSTVAGEIGQERDDAIQFLSATTKYLEQAQIIGAQNPAIIPLLGKLLQFGVRKVRTGRDVEGAIDDFIDKADRMAKHLADNPQPKPPTPEEIKAQTEREKGQMEMQKMQQAARIDEQNDQRRAQQEMMQLQHDQGAQAAEEQRQTRLAEMKFQFEMRTLQMREEMERRKTELQMQAQAIQQQREREHEEHRMGLERQQREHEHAFNMREMEAKAKENDAARAHQAKQRKANGSGKEA